MPAMTNSDAMIMMKNIANKLLGISKATNEASGEDPYRKITERLEGYYGPLHGTRVLEAGVAENPDFLANIDRSYRLKEAVGINLTIAETKQITPTMRVEHGDLRKIAYPENYFDLIVSSSVFEHVHNFDVAISEMHRVLKPGGMLFSIFGPIWSAPFGHHLWFWDGSKNVTYHNLILPAFCHLLMSQTEICEWLRQKGEAKAEQIADYVCSSRDQNQLMFSDYDRFVSESAFERVFLKGYDSPIDGYKIEANHIRRLNKMFPADQDRFLFDGIVMLLCK
jgi:SAM-dependent methyltransferase